MKGNSRPYLLLVVPLAFLLSNQIVYAGAIHEAASTGDIYKVKKLLALSRRLADVKDYTGRTPLHYAANAGHKEVAELLLEKGADINATGVTGATALIVAARQGHESIVILLWTKGAAVSERDSAGHTALQYAVINGHALTATFLLGKVGNVNEKDKGASDNNIDSPSFLC